MTPREHADEVMDVTWGGWGSGDPWQHVPAFVTHRDRIEAAIVAATEAERERCAEDKRNWQPINTAPKDGTVILLHVPGFDSNRHCREAGPNITFGYYSTEKSWSHSNGWVSLETEDESDYEGGYYQVPIFLDDTPTHWMPVPDEPNTNPISR